MLSKKAKYAIKSLEFIAKQKQDHPILISEVSKRAKVPRKFLEAILLELKKDGILSSKLGKYGGYNLRKKPKEINIGHVIRLIDGPIALVPCVSYKFYERCLECENEATCGLRDAMHQLREGTNKLLDKISLAEILKREQRLKVSGKKIIIK